MDGWREGERDERGGEKDGWRKGRGMRRER